ncbi:hypothetical protein MMC08_007371 [Hypocenomyce scalaris]|nr:hypothetical protein [Hypocenomyce scalaris]
MAQQRSFSFPLSRDEDTARTSPFEVQPDDALRLNASEGFRIIRKLLVNQQKSAFCPHHQPLGKADETAWLLHRDITHALILPILEIYRQAIRLGESLLCTRNIFDLELAFRGEARGAFSWLQCFIVEEEDWCSTRGCPACIVTHVLQSEPTIRIVLVGCRLSNYLRQPDQAPTLPLFDFWLSSLRRALDEDPFWGPSHWEDIEVRASSLEKGIQELIRQCCELAELVVKTGNGSLAKADTSIPYHNLSVKSPEVRPSKMAKRQQDLAQEEQSWMQRIILGCWTTLMADAAKARRVGSVSRPTLLVPLRARSLTS